VIGELVQLVPRSWTVFSPEDDLPIVRAGSQDGAESRMGPSHLFFYFNFFLFYSDYFLALTV
jgi:hypothetical protein